MRKLSALLIGLVLTGSVTMVHAQSYSRGKFIFTLGYGAPNLFGSRLKNDISSYNWYSGFQSPYTYKVKNSGPVFLKCDYGLSKVVSMGLSLGYSSSTVTETYSYVQPYYTGNGNYVYYDCKDIRTYHYTSLSIGLRMNFHFAVRNKLDPYIGFAT